MSTSHAEIEIVQVQKPLQKDKCFSASYKDPLTQQTEQLPSKISEEEVQAGQKAQLPLCLPVLSQTAGAQSYKIVWSEGLLRSFCASAAATLGRGITSKIVFHNFVRNILSLVLRQKCKILICQKKRLQKKKTISSSFQLCTWLEEEELCSAWRPQGEKVSWAMGCVSHARALLTGMIWPDFTRKMKSSV